ncbi:MAG TPA: class I lanthipeptide [Thermoanaerobaculia bacterium]|jgi:hypothetical protein|nr:class I lanthipeptide [Thermoanaerobaculia bacterium]
MKKVSKRLNLNRETLRSLDKDHLEAVNGGWPTDASCANSCDPISVRFCPSTPCTTADCG